MYNYELQMQKDTCIYYNAKYNMHVVIGKLILDTQLDFLKKLLSCSGIQTL